MNNLLQENFKSFIEKYPLDNTRFCAFCENATQLEFLEAQKPFFYAVQAFPQMLCLLASKIKKSENRLLVIENLWEEHGQGNVENFHVKSYQQYLKALGWNQNEIQPHPAVTYWAEKLLNNNESSYIYATRLCAIEYIYTRISDKIIKTLSSFSLLNEQTHYKTHAVLDIEHAKEMMQVIFSEIKEHPQWEEIHNEDILEIFSQSVDDFVLMLNQLSILTQQEAHKISQEKIAFYYSRESSQPELYCLDKIAKKEPKILIICSGGEHIFNILKNYPDAHFVAIDINPHQIELTRNKINNALSNNYPYEINTGKFELIFSYLRQSILNPRFNYSDNKCYQLNYFLNDLSNKNFLATDIFKSICQDIFSNHNLELIFTSEATKYSNQSFSQHFYDLILNQIMESKYGNINPNLFNILGFGIKQDYLIEKHPSIEYFCGTFESYFQQHPDEKFDLISTSNIGDWMPDEKFKSLINQAKRHLLPNSLLISRKLLGNYNLKEMFSEDLYEPLHDDTGFYSEVACLARKQEY